LHRNSLLKHAVEGKMEGRRDVTGCRGRTHKQLLDDLKEKRDYGKLKENLLWKGVWTCCKTGYSMIE